MATNTNFYVKPEYVLKGGWTNWDGDAATGGQITLGKNLADLMAIFIGIFVVFVEGGLWTVLTIALFDFNRRRRRKRRGIIQPDGTTSLPPNDMDGLYHQQQTILRNSDGAISIASAYFKLWSAWGVRDRLVLRRTLPLILLALLSFGFFLVAVPFIAAYNLLENMGDDVLIKSPNCGFWTASIIESEATAYNALKNRSWEAVTYVDSCYEGTAESALCDQFLPRRQLPVAKWKNVGCPFDESICLSKGKYPAFELKTEVLDSHKDFGINAPKEDRVTFQRITTCAPLAVEDFSKVHDGYFEGEKLLSVYYGRTSFSSMTYNVSSFAYAAKSTYNLDTFFSYIGEGEAYSQTFEPIAELQRDDADLSVVLLNNNGIFIKGINGSCSDPFFSATKTPAKLLDGYYMPDNLVTAIGCTDQYVFGNPVSGEFTKPASWSDATGNITFIKTLSKRQAAAYITLSWSHGLPGAIGTEVTVLGSSALKAIKYPGLVINLQNSLANDQWKKEVEYWFRIGLAKMQLLPLLVATGPPDPTMPGLNNTLPAISAGRDDMVDMICSSQKIHNTEFKNFHRVGFIMLIVIGALIIIFPALLTKFILSRLRRADDAAAWKAYGQLQLQRMATEGAGVQGWKGYEDEVPVLDPPNRPAGDIGVSTVGAGLPHTVWVGPEPEVESDDGEQWDPGVGRSGNGSHEDESQRTFLIVVSQNDVGPAVQNRGDGYCRVCHAEREPFCCLWHSPD
ncbi:hypothetical protein B0J13DRAFT_596510 [Dactylonectria estremocensis]|uniref:Uncharacterized protein n=1 Tax=Dactylonectria estremocensis TaxID=1079267 RepID=A0A9P9ELU2_9HYPO|nr:hypothetical protein B0J13DRAFT_596510 [Dactylonectria estremocensis]